MHFKPCRASLKSHLFDMNWIALLLLIIQIQACQYLSGRIHLVKRLLLPTTGFHFTEGIEFSYALYFWRMNTWGMETFKWDNICKLHRQNSRFSIESPGWRCLRKCCSCITEVGWHNKAHRSSPPHFPQGCRILGINTTEGTRLGGSPSSAI